MATMSPRIYICNVVFILSYTLPIYSQEKVIFTNEEYNASFRGVFYKVDEVYGDTLYLGTLRDSLYNKISGLFSKDLSRQLFIKQYSNCTQLVDIKGKRRIETLRYDDFYVQEDYYVSNYLANCFYSFRLRDFFRDSTEISKSFCGCQYNPKDNSWFFGQWVNGNHDNVLAETYGINKHNGIYREADASNKWFFNFVVCGTIFFFFLVILFHDLLSLIHLKTRINEYWISLFLVIFSYIIIPHGILFFQPIFPFVLLILIRICLPKSRIIRNSLKCLSYFLVFVFLLHNNMFVNEKISIGNDILSVKWKPGIGIVKRHLIRNTIEQMKVVDMVDRDGNSYSLCVNPNLVNCCTFEAVVGRPDWWASLLLPHSLPILTYRECLFFLEKLKEITSLDNIDILSYNEISQLIQNGNVMIDNDRFYQEFSSSYLTTYQIIENERLIPCYNNIVVLTKDRSTDHFLYKNAAKECSFRLAIRQSKIGRREFDIIGIKKDLSKTYLPDTVTLLKINNIPIERYCYEKFEEFEIESYFQDRRIEYIEKGKNKPCTFFQKGSNSDYWYYPIFKY